jgi:P4 family phage/plasmid primase-like protien
METTQPDDKKPEEEYKDFDQIAEEVAYYLRNELMEELTENKAPSPHKFARVLTEKLKEYIPIRTFVVKDRVIGTFIYDRGIYREGEKDLERLFSKVMFLLGMENRSRRYVGYKTDFMSILRDSTYTEADFNEKLILYGDMVLDWEAFFYHSDSLSSYAFFPSPDLYVFHKIPHKIDLETLVKYSDRSYDEVLEGFRNECTISKYYEDWAGDKYPLLLELTGYPLLAGKYPLKSLFVIWGDRDSGKTTFSQLLISLLGKDNIASTPIQDLASGSMRFSRIELYHKLANICDDLPNKIVHETGWIKEMTGESLIKGERKFRDPIYFYNYAKLIFLCNNPPIVENADNAFWSRVVCLEFPNKFERNEGIKKAIIDDLLPKEAPKLLAFSLLAIRNAYIEGKFSFQDTPKDAKRKWMRRSDSVFNFIETGKEEGWLTEEEGVREEASFLYDLYLRFCNNEEINSLSRREFTERMAGLKHTSHADRGKRYYKGIKILRDKLPDHLRGFTGLE